MKRIEDMTYDELGQIEADIRIRREMLDSERRRAWQDEELAMGELMPFGAGDIGMFCADLVFHARRLKRGIRGEFNGRLLTAHPDSSAGDLCRAYFRDN